MVIVHQRIKGSADKVVLGGTIDKIWSPDNI